MKLPNPLPTEARDVLMTWEVRIPLPCSNRSAHRRNRSPQKVIDTRRRQRGQAGLEQAGHTPSRTSPAESRIGTELWGAGQEVWLDLRGLALLRFEETLQRRDRYRDWLAQDSGRTQTELAQKEGLSKSWVSQMLALERLTPQVVEAIRRGQGRVPKTDELLKIARLPAGEQMTALVRIEAEGRRFQGGTQMALARARHYRALLDSGACLTLREVADREGVSCTLVGQMLGLLRLPGSILEAVDVPKSELPAGFRMKELVRLGRVGGEEAEVGWREMVGG